MRAVGVKDRGTQAREVILGLRKVRDELCVLAVRIEINVRAVDPRKGVPVKGQEVLKVREVKALLVKVGELRNRFSH